MTQGRDILTIGYGNRSREEVVRLLRDAHVGFVVDVRSSPKSRFDPDFDREALERWLPAANLRYLFMGQELGGRPADPDCYDTDGHVDYARCLQSATFSVGIERLVAASQKGFALCLLCSELRPEQCHRFRLLGEMLVRRGVPVLHFDAMGRLRGHRQLSGEDDAGQLALLPNGLGRSRRAYRSTS